MEGLTPENFDDFINHIYDRIFKLFFKHKPVAVDCLTHFVDKDIVDKLDLDVMTLKDTNFISKDLKSSSSFKRRTILSVFFNHCLLLL